MYAPASPTLPIGFPQGSTGIIKTFSSPAVAPNAPLAPGTAIQVMHYRGVVVKTFLTIRKYLGRGRYATVPLRSPLYLVRLDLRMMHPFVRHCVQVHIPEEHRGDYTQVLQAHPRGDHYRKPILNANPTFEMRVFGDELALVRSARNRKRAARLPRAQPAGQAQEPLASQWLQELRQELAARAG
jgi:hypothetical protein